MKNRWKWRQKPQNAGGLKPERMEMSKKVLELGEKYKYVN
jgi:hypothetical protein